MQPFNSVIQSTAVDLLQAIIGRGEIDALSLEIVEAAVVGKLFLGVHMNRLDLQNKLLHLLHSLISASVSNQDTHSGKASISRRQSEALSEETQTQASMQDPTTRTSDVNPLLIQTLVDGIAIQTNRPILQHWLDFILMTVPQFQPTMQTVLAPLNDCLCRQLLLALSDVRQASTKDTTDDISSTTTDSELIMFLNSLERLILLSLTHTSDTSQLEEDGSAFDKGAHESSGFLGYVSNVFSSDITTNTPEDQLSVGVLLFSIFLFSLTWLSPGSLTWLSIIARGCPCPFCYLGLSSVVGTSDKIVKR